MDAEHTSCTIRAIVFLYVTEYQMRTCTHILASSISLPPLWMVKSRVLIQSAALHRSASKVRRHSWFGAAPRMHDE